MNNNQRNILCNLLNLGTPLTQPQQVHGGLLHLMWRVDTDTGSYAVKQLSKNIIFDAAKRNEYELTEMIAKEFQKQGIPTVASLTKDGASLVDAGENTFIVYPWVDAKMVCHEEITLPHIAAIGNVLACMHAIRLTVPMNTHATYTFHSIDELSVLIKKSVEKRLPFAVSLQNYEPLLLTINNRYQESIPLLQQNCVVSHGDLDQKNVLWDKDNHPILIDWESARFLNPTHELVNAALDWGGITTGSLNREFFRGMIESYKQSAGTVDVKILEPVFYAILGNWLNWMIYNIQRSLGAQEHSDEYAIGVEQVTQTLRTIVYLESQIEACVSEI